jgi:DNA polymerase elongation subunit (family B)
MEHIGKEMINGKSDKIFDLATDMDFASLYPSIIEAFNIAPEGIDLKLFVEKLNKETNEYESITDEFMDDFMSCDSVNFCHKYYGLASYSEMIECVKENF